MDAKHTRSTEFIDDWIVQHYCRKFLFIPDLVRLIQYFHHGKWLNRQEKLDLKVGDYIDHKDRYGKFYEAKILERDGDRILVKYVGWDDSWNEWSTLETDIAYPGTLSHLRPKRIFPIADEDSEKFVHVWIKPSEHHDWVVGRFLTLGLGRSCGQIQVRYCDRFNGWSYVWVHVNDIRRIKSCDKGKIPEYMVFP